MRSAVILAVLLAASRAFGHAAAVPVEAWGPFLPDTVPCLREMSRATHECFETVLDLEMRCRAAQVRGESCDTAQLQAETTAAVNTMLDAAAHACSEGQLTEIGYFGRFDNEADLFVACQLQARAAVAAMYAPAAGSSGSEAAACMTAVAAYARKTIHHILERQRPIMEWFAAQVLEGEEKVDRTRALQLELSGNRPRWAAGLTEVCPAFETVYGRSAESFVRTMKERADCVLSKTYVTTAATCLAQVCGNAVQEGTEACDDGNQVDGDGCRNDCTLP